MSQRHVIFGAGQIGSVVARMLLEQGHEVRIAKRSPGGIPAGTQAVLGDAGDPSFCASAAEGATTVYHCMNVPYSTTRWAEFVPLYMNNLIDATARAKARLVVLDNVYMLGKPNGKPLNEDSPVNPCSHKGEIRAQAAQAMFDAHRRGDIRATTCRASDFYGPGGTVSMLGDHFWPQVLKGGSGQIIPDPDAVHTYHYINDVAAAVATLGVAPDDAFGGPWMIPCQPAETFRDLVHRLEKPFGGPIKMTVVPNWMRATLGIFTEALREMPEMAYQWEEPFIIDDRRFRERFKVLPEDHDRAAAATVAWARAHYAHA